MAAVELVRSQNSDRSPRIPARRYPLTHIHDGFVYEVYRVTSENKFALRMRALTFEKAFGYTDPFLTHDKVRSYTKEGGEVIFVKTRGHHAKDIAIVTQDVRKVTVNDQTMTILNPGIRVVFPEYQKHGIATHLAEEAIKRHRPYFVVGKTRTWRIPRMYEDTRLIKSIHPIDGLFTSGMQEVLRLTLDRSTLLSTDLRTGVCLGIYPPEESSRFIPPSTNARGVAIDRRIRELGVQPERGDGIVYCAVINQEAVEVAIAGGRLEQAVAGSVVSSPIARLWNRMRTHWLRLLPGLKQP